MKTKGVLWISLISIRVSYFVFDQSKSLLKFVKSFLAMNSSLDDDCFSCLIRILGSQAVLVYATVYGYVIGWDTRANRTAWEIKNKSREGENILFAVKSFLIL